MKKSVALLVSSLSVFALCSNVEGMGTSWRQQLGAAKAANAKSAKTQAVKPSAEVAKPNMTNITQTSVDLVNILSRLFLYDAPLKQSQFQYVSSSPNLGRKKTIDDVKNEIQENIRNIERLYKTIEESKFTKIPASSIQDSTGKNISIRDRINQILIVASKYPGGVHRKSETIVSIDDISALCEICRRLQPKLVDAQN